MTTLPEEAVTSADIIQVITDLRLAILQDDDEGLAEHAEPMIKAKEIIAQLSAFPFLPVQGAVKKLEETLRELITDQSEGEWDEKTIEKDVRKFSARILSALEPSAARELALDVEFATIRAMIYCYEGDSAQAFEAQKALAKIEDAIRALSSPDHADAGKVEGDGNRETLWKSAARDFGAYLASNGTPYAIDYWNECFGPLFSAPASEGAE